MPSINNRSYFYLRSKDKLDHTINRDKKYGSFINERGEHGWIIEKIDYKSLFWEWTVRYRPRPPWTAIQIDPGPEPRKFWKSGIHSVRVFWIQNSPRIPGSNAHHLYPTDCWHQMEFVNGIQFYLDLLNLRWTIRSIIIHI